MVQAMATIPKDLMPVPERFKMQCLAGLVLDALNLGPLDFPDAAAIDADEMVVMRALVLDLELRHAVWGRNALGEMAFLDHLQRSEHGHLADAFGLDRLV